MSDEIPWTAKCSSRKKLLSPRPIFLIVVRIVIFYFVGGFFRLFCRSLRKIPDHGYGKLLYHPFVLYPHRTPDHIFEKLFLRLFARYPRRTPDHDFLRWRSRLFVLFLHRTLDHDFLLFCCHLFVLLVRGTSCCSFCFEPSVTSPFKS